MGRFEENFPERPLLRQFRVPANPPPDAPVEEQLGEMMTELKAHEQHRERIEAMYERNGLPLSSFATFLGRPVFEAVRYLASEPTLEMRVDGGHPSRWDTAIELLRHARDVVLDATVLAGALVLGLLEDLPRLGFKFIVPRAVFDEIRELSLNAARPRTSAGTIGFYQGKLFFHESSPAELAREVETLERVLRFVREHCEVVGGEATLELPAELREQLEKLIGEAATDALALAKKRNNVLWTDDLGLQILANDERLDVRSVWTQAILSASRDAYCLSHDQYIQAVKRMIECNYKFTRLSAREFADLLRDTRWRADTPLGIGLIRMLKDVALINPDNRKITAAALVLIWRECPQRPLARELIAAILDGIGRDRSGPKLAAFIYRGNGFRIPFSPEVRSLKRMLRSWRSRDGALKPANRVATRTRPRRRRR